MHPKVSRIIYLHCTAIVTFVLVYMQTDCVNKVAMQALTDVSFICHVLLQLCRTLCTEPQGELYRLHSACGSQARLPVMMIVDIYCSV